MFDGEKFKPEIKYGSVWSTNRTVFYLLKFGCGDGVFKVCGEATCHPEDNFNMEFGVSLAKIRAYQKVYKKLEKLLLKETYKPGWKKEKNKISFEGEADYFINYSQHNRKIGMTFANVFEGLDRELDKKFKEGKKVKVTIEDA